MNALKIVVPMIRLYHRLHKKKQSFQPIHSKKVSMYVCGPTIYDRIHLGNGRSLVVFDVLYRLLRHTFPEVVYVRNITDVDDKINHAAAKRCIPIETFTKETLGYFHEDAERLGVLPPTHEPKATEHISTMISMIETLLKKGKAYLAGGHVLFSVASFPLYGTLSGMGLEGMKHGARVETAPYKENPLDFVLWKPSLETETGWASPWGRGRPGWHIECSAMSSYYFGETFDIHGGGSDLCFPHHENERAQSCACFDREDSATHWLHNGMLLVEGQKMSKSLGNFILLKEAMMEYPSSVIRWAYLSTHYRQELNWTEALLKQSQQALRRIHHILYVNGKIEDMGESMVDSMVLKALEDDLNTPLALQRFYELTKQLLQQWTAKDAWILKSSLDLLGITLREDTFYTTISPSEKHRIQELIEKRLVARQAKDYRVSDAIRDALLEKGIVLEDTRTASGEEETHWYYS